MKEKKKITPEEVSRRLRDGESYGQYVNYDPETEELPCSCKVREWTMRWVVKDGKSYCKLCGEEIEW